MNRYVNAFLIISLNGESRVLLAVFYVNADGFQVVANEIGSCKISIVSGTLSNFYQKFRELRYFGKIVIGYGLLQAEDVVNKALHFRCQSF